MAKIIFSGAGITEIRGKAGGSVFSRNASGAFWRNRVNPVNPQTSRQLAVRSGFTSISTQWRDLTNAERQAWSDFAPTMPFQDALGQSKIYTGNQLFMKLNQSLTQASPATPLLTSPPSPVTSPVLAVSLLEFGVDGTDLTAVFTISPATVPAGFVMRVFASPGLSAGIMRPQASLFRLVSTSPTIATGVANIAPDYEALYGLPSEGSKVYVRVVLVSSASGQQFEVFKGATVVVAV